MEQGQLFDPKEHGPYGPRIPPILRAEQFVHGYVSSETLDEQYDRYGEENAPLGGEISQHPIADIESDTRADSRIQRAQEGYEAGVDLPPIVMSNAGYLIDGNHRIAAALRHDYTHPPTIHTDYDPLGDD